MIVRGRTGAPKRSA